MNPLKQFFAHIRARRLARQARLYERRRAIIIKQRDTRKEKHKAFRYLDGILMEATNSALAAECGRDWQEKRRGV